ncbi:MAG: hypothetical protein COV10_00420 [Candidatus Vogelbacteria bacterium CG10_big_fil_rev_8_21_14_0_10_51_16]|uniref:Nudix hydrolase domain-containing protein n=1 Tax=Candidatus Vogelbacteria bacterium CG10_big_fil_rev_8_21_14_0_10_51_16 TaxID=1975045 RepID=A0A2H0RFF4_9BACT|nr:MAG: hypothetical protein COV10_00420 [Candidatus Vogelbacteria bacterium CG10_big_fil_rev_8_21_14_0_10_51_16]
MKLLATLREHDIFPDRKPVADSSYPFQRDAVRMVLMDGDGKVAAIGGNIPNHYGLPGGGVIAPETILDALAREAKQETGCEIENIEELGYVFEYGVGKEGKKHIQEEHLFRAQVKGIKGERRLTKKEKDWKAEVFWLPLEELKVSIEAQAPSFACSVALIALK